MSKNDPTPDPDKRMNIDNFPLMLMHTNWCVWCYPKRVFASGIVNGESICEACLDKLVADEDKK